MSVFSRDSVHENGSYGKDECQHRQTSLVGGGRKEWEVWRE